MDLLCRKSYRDTVFDMRRRVEENAAEARVPLLMGTFPSTPPHPYRNPYIKGPKMYFSRHFFTIFSTYLAPSGAKYRAKGLAVAKTGEG